MARTSVTHYISPLAINIVPNANGSTEDLAVAVDSGAKIKVYSPLSDIDLQDGSYREWTLSGRNRRLADANVPYTIYARLPKQSGKEGYLVFAPKTLTGGKWLDKYPYVTKNGIGGETTGAATGPDWYVRLGDVSLVVDGKRTVEFDTGILGTEEFNTKWALSPDAMPLRLILTCTAEGEDAGPTPYVYWGQSLSLTASLVEGWTSTDVQRFHHWQIQRNTGVAEADEGWPGESRAEAFASSGSIVLSHAHGSGDDFNGAVAATFTVTAWGVSQDDGETLEVLGTASINIMAETVERYAIAKSSAVMKYNPKTSTYTPAAGVIIHVRATDQRGDLFDMTNGQVASAAITAQYATVGSDQWTDLTFTGQSDQTAQAVVPVSAFSGGQSVNVRLLRTETDEEEVTVQREVARYTIAYVQDGEDGRDADSVRTNILLRTVFDKGIDFVKEAWTGDFNHVFIDGAPDTPIEGHKGIRINASTMPSGEFADFSQNVLARVKPGTWYTLSFNYFSTGGDSDRFFETFVWSGVAGHTAIDVSEGMYIDGVHQSAAATRGDGCVQWPSDWHGNRHTVTFKTVGTFTTDYVNVLFRCNAGGQASICMPKLEEGETATAYLPNDDDLMGKDGRDGIDGQDGRDGIDGQDGADGQNAYLVTPTAVIINQSISNPTGLSSLLHVIDLMISSGGNVYTPTAVTVKSVVDHAPDGVVATQVTSSAATGRATGITVTRIGTYSYTEGGQTKTQYYDHATFVVDVTFSAGVLEGVTVDVYVNLFGSFKTYIEGDVETSIAQKLTYGYDPTSQAVIPISTFGSYIRSSEKNISTLTKNTEKKNLFPVKGWRSNESNYPAADYDKAHDRSYDAEFSVNDIYSPVITLDEGQYCFSGYVPYDRTFDTVGNTILLVYGCSSADPASGTDYIDASSVGEIANDTITIDGVVYIKRYAVFNVPSTALCSINLWGSYGYADIAQPKIVIGNTPDTDTSMSVISQTAEEIELSINDGLERTGIDIKNRKITLDAETVEVTGTLAVPRVETVGNPERKIEIDNGTFKVYNKDGVPGISIGWDEDGEPFILLSNSDGTDYYKLNYHSIDKSSGTFTADSFDTDYLMPLVPDITQANQAIYGGITTGYSKAYLYHAGKNLATGAYQTTDPDNPSSLVDYSQQRADRDGKMFTTNSVSSVLKDSPTPYLDSNGAYYITPKANPYWSSHLDVVCKEVYWYDNGELNPLKNGLVYIRKLNGVYYFCNSNGGNMTDTFDTNHIYPPEFLS